MSEFTKTEWQVNHELTVYALDSDGVHNEFTCTLEGSSIDGIGAHYQELKANAHLISAAPDMYRALEEAVDYIGEIADCEEDVMAHDRWKQALAKARGE